MVAQVSARRTWCDRHHQRGFTRPTSFYAEGTFSGSWSDDYGYARFSSLSGTPLWDPVGNRAPGAGSSYALTGYCLSRLAQVSLGVATILGQPARGANSSNCLPSLLLAGIGSCDIMIHRLQDASTELVLLIHVRSLPALRFRLRPSGLGGQCKHDLLYVCLSGSQAIISPTTVELGNTVRYERHGERTE